MENESQKSEPESVEEHGPTLLEMQWIPYFDFKDGKMEMEQIVAWFSRMIETGYIWKMPSSMLIDAMNLIEHGYIGSPTREMNS